MRQYVDWSIGSAGKMVVDYAYESMGSQLVSRLCSRGQVLVLRVLG